MSNMDEQDTVTPDDEMMDFSTSTKPVTFRLNGDVYTAPPELPGLAAMAFTRYKDTITSEDVEERIEAFRQIFTLLLLPESAAKFVGYMEIGSEKPIGLEKAQRVMKWLMEKLGMRPTEPSSNSSATQEEAGDGTSSTVAAEHEALTSN